MSTPTEPYGLADDTEAYDLADDTDPWHYLKIAYDIEEAASRALVALQQGKTFLAARRVGVKSYRTNHRRHIRYLGETHEYDGIAPSFGEVIVAIALANLASDDRNRFEIEYDPLRYPTNVYSHDEWRAILDDLCRRLSAFKP